VEKADGISPSRGVLTHRVVFMLVIFAMALLLSMPKPNRVDALTPYFPANWSL